jgi:hypothetical protein
MTENEEWVMVRAYRTVSGRKVYGGWTLTVAGKP